MKTTGPSARRPRALEPARAGECLLGAEDLRRRVSSVHYPGRKRTMYFSDFGRLALGCESEFQAFGWTPVFPEET